MRKFYSGIFTLFLLVFSSITASAQLTGTKTIPGDYPTIAAAVTALNASGVGAGGVTFLVAAGHTETTTAPITITTAGSATDFITFMKNGAGVNPKVTRTDAGTLATSAIGGNGDAIIRIEGTDGIRFNQIDLQANNQGIEYGYFANKTSATNGVQDLMITGSTITMNKGTSAYVIGIHIGNGTTSVSSATGFTVTALSGRNRLVTLTGNTVQNVHTGIYNRGSSATGFYDENFDISSNTIQNFGGGSATTTYGIYFIYQNNVTTNANIINNAAGGGIPHTATLYGIFYSTISGALVADGNTITMNNSSTSGSHWINNGTNATTTASISSNTFAGTIAATSASYIIYNNNSFTGPVTVNGNTISGTIAKTGASGGLHGYYNNGSPTAGTETISNNNFSNVTLAGTSSFTGIQSTTAAAAGHTIFGNTISNVSGGTGTITGINVTSANTRNIYSNLIHTLSNGGTLVGITSGSGFTSGAIYKNKIYGLSSTSSATTAGLVSGISITGGTSPVVHNNLIGDLQLTNSGSSDGIRGINITSTTITSTVSLYYNTIYINAATAGALFGSSGVFHTASATSTTAALDMRNNIIVNTSSSTGSGITAALRRSGAALDNYSTSSNNNLFYAGTPSATNVIYYNGTTGYETIGDFKAHVAPRELASFTEMPTFLSTAGTSPMFLHIDPSVPTQIESGAVPISGITDDYDGQARNASTPDVGADEFAGTAADFSAPGIVYSNLVSSCDAGNRTLTATLTDGSGVATGANAPRIYYSKNGGAWFSQQGTMTGGSVTNGTWSFSIIASDMGGLTTGDVVSYYLIAEDVNGNVGSNPSGVTATNVNTITTHPSSPATYTVQPSMSGTIMVGAGQTYTTLTAAVNAYHNSCLTGPTTFVLTDATYTETVPVTINAHVDASATNTLTIKPQTGVNTVISGTSATSIIRLNGADYVTIDGSNNGTTSRNLTIENTSTATGSSGISVESTGTGAGSTFNVIRNLNVRAGANTSSSGPVGILVTGDDNDNLTITNNAITKASIGIRVSTSTVAGADNNLIISDNVIGSVTATDYVSFGGINVSNSPAAQISGNRVFNVISTISGDSYGIQLGSNSDGSVIRRNIIQDVKNNNTGGWGAYGVNLSGASANVEISNNMISGMSTINYSATSLQYNPFGIRLAGGTGHKVYFNSVNLYGSQFASGTSGTLSSALILTNNSITGTDIRNNILVNGLTGAAGSKSYAIYAPTGTTFGIIDYNDYYVSGTYGILGYLGSDKATLVDWRLATGQDLNSRNIEPFFVSPSDLHLVPGNNIILNDLGTPIAGITTDIDNQARSATAPDMGADEFSPPVGVDVSPTSLVQPGIKSCYSNAETVVVRIKNLSSSVLDFSASPVTVSATVTGAGAGTLSKIVSSGTLASGDSLDVMLSGTLDMTASGTYTFTISAIAGGDVNPANNTMTATRTVVPVNAGTVTASPSSYCVSGGTPTLTLSGNAGGNIQWQESTAGAGGPWTNVGTNSTTYTPAAPITATSYYQVVVSCGLNSATSNVATVTILNPVITSTTPASRCGIGQVTLGATAGPGNTLSWYTASTGGTRVGTGTSYTTPELSATTNYYVAAAIEGGTANVGAPNTSISASRASQTSVNTVGINFSVLSSTARINSVTIYPTATIGSNYTISVVKSGVIVASYTGTTTVSGTTAAPVAEVVPVNFTLPSGSGYLMYFTVNPGVIRNSGGDAFPYTVPDVISLTTSTLDGFYYYFYNWSVTGICESARSVVTATVTTPPAITATATASTICNGQSTTLNVASPNPGYTYTWTPGGAMGNSITVTPSATTKYYVNAVDNSGGANHGCATRDSVTITVNPTPSAITVTPSSPVICAGSVQSLTASGAGASGTVKVGSGMLTNTTSTPYKGFWGGQKVQMIYTAAELQALGLQAGSNINAVSFDILSFTSPYTFNGFTVGMKNTSSTVASTTFETGTTTVFGPVNFTLTGSAPFTVTHTLTTPFVWDGTSNLLVDFCFNNNNGGGVSGNSASVASSSTSPQLTAYWSADNTADLCSSPGTATITTTRPNIGLTFQNVVNYTWSPAAGLFTDAAATAAYTGGSTPVVYAKPGATTTYTVTASNPFSCTSSNTVTVTVNDLPVITTEPVSQAVCSGANVTFTATATGTALAYQWQKNGADIAGANSNTLTLNAVTPADAADYRLIVSGACPPNDTSNVAVLTVNEPPAITGQPSSQTVCAGATVSFSVTATGTALTYQWQKDGSNIAGATGSTLNLSSVTTANAGSYTVVVSGTCPPSVTSSPAVLTVNTAPAITAHPASQAACPGTNVTFDVTATGTGITYQWRKNGTDIAGQTGSSLTLTGVGAADAGSYSVVVSGTCPAPVTSNDAVLTINSVPAITSHPQSQTVCAGQNATFNVTATGTGVTYQWQKNGSNIAGANSASYTITGATMGDAGSYTVIVSGTCSPSATSNAAVLTVDAAPVISQQPASQTVCAGGNASFSVTASGVGLTYQWYRNNAAISGATANTYTITGVTTANAGQYHVVVNSSCGTSVTSSPATLTVNTAPAITVQPASQTACLGSTVTFSVTATGSSLTYQWRKDGTAIAGATSSTLTINNVSAADLGGYSVVVSGICGTPVTSSTANLAISATNTWLGTVNSDWNNASNWCAGVPTSTSVILIPAGTPFSAILLGNASVRDVTIQSGATLTIGAGGNLNLFGNIVNNGTVTASAGTLSIRGTTPQSIPALTVGNLVMDGTGGVTLGGTLTIGNALTLTAGHITLGSNNLILPGGAMGSVASHIITNGTGVVTSNNINAASVIFPVGPDAASYNPVMIANGGGRNYSVRVATGLTPTLFNNARAINRTWNVSVNTAPAAAASITFGYADAHANASAVPTANMEVGRHTGTAWSIINPGGVAPFGTAALRTVTTATTAFGPMVVSNAGGILDPTSLPSIDLDITRMVLRPNVFEVSTILEINVARSMKINWTITDAAGRVVMTFRSNLTAGRTDIPLMLRHLANGTYYLSGETEKGRTAVLRFIRL